MNIKNIKEEDLIKFFSLFNVFRASQKCDHALPGEILKMLVNSLQEEDVFSTEDDIWVKDVALKYKRKIDELKEEKKKFLGDDILSSKVLIAFGERWDVFWDIVIQVSPVVKEK